MTPSVGLLIGLPLTILVVVISLGVGVFYRNSRYQDDQTLVRAGAFGVLLLTIVVALLCYWPLKTEYHFWKTTKAKVTDVNSRLVGPDGGETKYVVTLEGVGERGCNDTRCASVKVGDTLTLKCKRVYQWGATPGYDCNFVSNQKGS